MWLESLINKILRLFNTVKYLRPIQIYYRLYYLARSISRKRRGFHYTLAITSESKSLILQPSITSYTSRDKNGFQFLNLSHTFESDIDWNFSEYGKLWTYNLTYFDYLQQEMMRKEDGLHIIKDFISNADTHRDALEPFPISLRVVNWVKFLSRYNIKNKAVDNNLYAQCSILMDNLEYHLLGNHLLENGFGLLFGAYYFQDNKFYAKAKQILTKELPEQVQADGGHFERSPMYHAIILEDLLDSINLGGVYGVASPHPSPLPRGEGISASWIDTAQRMLTWLRVMCHPDGEIGFFNDATLGIAPSLIELETYAKRLGIESVCDSSARLTHLQESGYIRLEQDEAVVLLDVGEIGPDYLPGHAHADTLSFELSLFDQRLIVNSGISCYGASGERLRQRGTSAHSTVEIDGENSSEVWGGFRVARRARPFDLKIAQELHKISVACAHDGYRRLLGCPVHNRSWTLQDGELIVTDSIRGEFTEAVAYYHLHPDVNIIYNSEAGEGVFELKTGQSANWSVSGGQVSIEETTWHPGFGLSLQNKTIKIVFSGREVVFTLQWNKG